MKTKTIVLIVVIGITALGALVYAGTEDKESKQKVTMSELPAVVQKTIQDNLEAGTITETAKKTKDGKTYYTAQVKKSAGDEIEIKVAEDGTLLSAGKEDVDD